MKKMQLRQHDAAVIIQRSLVIRNRNKKENGKLKESRTDSTKNNLSSVVSNKNTPLKNNKSKRRYC
jgi:hypothetical protein